MPVPVSKVYLVNPAYTSKIGEKLGKEIGLDKHTTSAYVLILRYLEVAKVLTGIPSSQRDPSIITH